MKRRIPIAGKLNNGNDTYANRLSDPGIFIVGEDVIHDAEVAKYRVSAKITVPLMPLPDEGQDAEEVDKANGADD